MVHYRLVSVDERQTTKLVFKRSMMNFVSKEQTQKQLIFLSRLLFTQPKWYFHVGRMQVCVFFSHCSLAFLELH